MADSATEVRPPRDVSTTETLVAAVAEFRRTAIAARQALAVKQQAKVAMADALRACGVDPKFLTGDETAEARFVGVNPEKIF